MRALLPGAPEWRLEEVVAIEDGLLLHDGDPFLVRDPAREERRAHAHGQPDLVARDGRGGRVEEHGRLVTGRRGQRDGIGAEERLGREGGHHVQAGRGEAHAHHVLHGRLHGEMADGAEVPAVAHGDHPHPDGLRLVDGQPHRLRPHDDAEALLGVDHRGGGRLALDPPARLGVELARLVVADIGAQHVRHAVRLHAPEVGHGQHVRRLRRVFLAHPQLLEDLRHRTAQRRFRDQDLVLGGNLEALEDHGVFLPRGW